LDKWILHEKYKKDIEQWIRLLENIWMGKWQQFYKNNVFKDKNKLSNIYKIRLFLLVKWHEKWIKNT
jgi:hypothetical protein